MKLGHLKTRVGRLGPPVGRVDECPRWPSNRANRVGRLDLQSTD
ncbi:unnamed protein product [Rhodiola kirilowii]